MSQDKKVAA
jgi:hypothetical protein